MARPDEVDLPAALAVRGLLAAIAIITFLTVGSELPPAGKAGARFGLGILLFALLVDLGRHLAGTGRPIRGQLSPHRQRARAQTDGSYETLQAAVKAYLDDGHAQPDLLDEIDEIAQARGLDTDHRQALQDQLTANAHGPAAPVSLLGVRLLSGLALTLGLGLTAARLAEATGFVLVPFVLLVTGTSMATLQWRARAAGARWTGLGLGVLGLGLFGLGALRILAAAPVAGGALLAVAIAGLAATVNATWNADARARPSDHDRQAGKLNRWLIMTLAAGVLVFAFPQAIAGGMTALGLPGSLVDVARLLVATVLVFLVTEAAGTWLTRRRGDEGDRSRRRRRAVLDDVLDELDQARSPSPEEIG